MWVGLGGTMAHYCVNVKLTFVSFFSFFFVHLSLIKIRNNSHPCGGCLIGQDEFVSFNLVNFQIWLITDTSCSLRSSQNGIWGGGDSLSWLNLIIFQGSSIIIQFSLIFTWQVGGFLASPLVRWLNSLLPAMGELTWPTLAQVRHTHHHLQLLSKVPVESDIMVGKNGIGFRTLIYCRVWCWPPPWRVWTRTSTWQWKWSHPTWRAGQTTWLLCSPASTPSMRTGMMKGLQCLDYILCDQRWINTRAALETPLQNLYFPASASLWCCPRPPPTPSPWYPPPTKRSTRWYNLSITSFATFLISFASSFLNFFVCTGRSPAPTSGGCCPVRAEAGTLLKFNTWEMPFSNWPLNEVEESDNPNHRT